jgi:aminoglycoside phosphotransferase (APT) family kinase protein
MDKRTTAGKLREYLKNKLPAAQNLVLSEFVQTPAAGPTRYIPFYADWDEDGRKERKGFCLRRDPGVGLLRELSSLKEQFLVLEALEKTAGPTPKVYWYEEDPSLLGGPFLVMEKVEGEVPNPLVACGQTVLRRRGRARKVAA